MTFLEENDAYLDCVNDEINTTNANGKMISRILMSVSKNEIERTKIGLTAQLSKYNSHVQNSTIYFKKKQFLLCFSRILKDNLWHAEN